MRKEKWLVFFLVLLTILVSTHLYYVLQVPNVPYWDDWDLILSTGLGPLSTARFFQSHNEHLIVMTRLLFHAFYRWTDLDFALMTQFGFVIYLLLVLTQYLLWKPEFKKPALSILVLLPFFSNLPIENTSWGMQMCIHFSLLFFFLAWFLFFKNKKSYLFRFFNCLLLVLSALSFASAVGFLIAGVLIFILMQLGLFGDNYKSWKLNGFSIFLLLLSSFILVSQISAHSQQRPAFDFLALTTYFFSIFSLSFGITQSGYLEIALSALLFIFLIFLYFKNVFFIKNFSNAECSLKITVSILSLLASLALISLGRYELGPAQAKASRYSELALPLFPVFSLLLATFLETKNKWLQRISVTVLFVFFIDNWRLSDYRTDHINRRLDGLECLKKSSSTANEINCPGLHHSNLSPYIAEAVQLRLKFISELWPSSIPR